jgi:predicted small lipoprotein YifL
MNSKSTNTGILVLMLLLAGCGQSGPLYVPGDPSTVHPPPQQPDNGDQNDEDTEDDDSQ